MTPLPILWRVLRMQPGQECLTEYAFSCPSQEAALLDFLKPPMTGVPVIQDSAAYCATRLGNRTCLYQPLE